MMAVKLDPASQLFADRMARQYPKAAAAGASRVGVNMRGQLRRAIRSSGGKLGVPKFEKLSPLSKYTRKLKKMSQIGGKSIVMYKPSRFESVIGWPDRLQPMAEQFHRGKKYSYDQQQKAGIIATAVARGLKTKRALKLVKDGHQQPERLLFEPYTKSLSPSTINSWFLKRYKEIEAREAAKT
jgi:hypothetical protein